jgi:hypothetical protein
VLGPPPEHLSTSTPRSSPGAALSRTRAGSPSTTSVVRRLLARDRQDSSGDRDLDPRLPGPSARAVRHRHPVGRPALGRQAPRQPRSRTAAAVLHPADRRRRGRLHPVRRGAANLMFSLVSSRYERASEGCPARRRCARRPSASAGDRPAMTWSGRPLRVPAPHVRSGGSACVRSWTPARSWAAAADLAGPGAT